MSEIGQCLLKAPLWNTSVPHTKKYPHIICTVAHVMMCVHLFNSDERKQDAATTAAHSKQIFELLKKDTFRCWYQYYMG